MDTITRKYEALIESGRKLVGVKIVKSREEFEEYDAIRVAAPITYCVAVKSATLGHSIKFTADTSGCGGSTRALGLEPPTEDFFNGKSGCSLGLYSDEKISADVAVRMKLCTPDAYGVVVKPLDLFEKEPDVVLAVVNTRNAMRIIQGYSYFYGMQENFCMSGNQAVCVEATAIPYLTGDINVSVFCSGTRFLAGWKDHEVVVGIPYARLGTVVEGIRMTVNAVEPDERKSVIASKLEDLGYSRDEIIFGDTYYLRLEREKIEARKKS